MKSRYKRDVHRQDVQIEFEENEEDVQVLRAIRKDYVRAKRRANHIRSRDYRSNDHLCCRHSSPRNGGRKPKNRQSNRRRG